MAPSKSIRGDPTQRQSVAHELMACEPSDATTSMFIPDRRKNDSASMQREAHNTNRLLIR